MTRIPIDERKRGRLDSMSVGKVRAAKAAGLSQRELASRMGTSPGRGCPPRSRGRGRDPHDPAGGRRSTRPQGHRRADSAELAATRAGTGRTPEGLVGGKAVSVTVPAHQVHRLPFRPRGSTEW